MDKSVVVRKVIMTVLTLLVIAYVIYVICRASFTQIKTVVAKESLAYDAIVTDCYVVRDETLIEYSGEGVISYAVDDGDKVSVNQTVAGVFDTVDSAGTKLEMSRLRSQIDSLTQLQKNSDALSKSPDEIDKAISTSLFKTNDSVNAGSFEEADKNIDSVLYYINERQLITGKSHDYNGKIEELKARLSYLESSSAKQKKSMEIKSPVTGYFVSSADGYENIFTSSQLKDMTPEDIDKEKLKPEEVSNNVVGKTINGAYWYVTCKVSSEEALKITNANSHGERIRLDIPSVSAEKINVELETINQESKSSDALAVFRGTFMNDEMADFRMGEIAVILGDEYTGISVPKSAIHEKELTKTTEDEDGNKTEEKKTVPGVYVKMGNEVSFRQIVPLYYGENAVICSSDKDSKVFTDSVKKLELYDEIIVEGANLYDGKIIG